MLLWTRSQLRCLRLSCSVCTRLHSPCSLQPFVPSLACIHATSAIAVSWSLQLPSALALAEYWSQLVLFGRSCFSLLVRFKASRLDRTCFNLEVVVSDASVIVRVKPHEGLLFSRVRMSPCPRLALDPCRRREASECLALGSEVVKEQLLFSEDQCCLVQPWLRSWPS